jgi:hypothetical protein
LTVQITARRSQGGLHLLVDSAGIKKMQGEGKRALEDQPPRGGGGVAGVVQQSQLKAKINTK